MVFFTLWLQLLGFTDYSASVLMALFAGGCAIGSAVGGYLGNPSGQHLTNEHGSEHTCVQITVNVALAGSMQ